MGRRLEAAVPAASSTSRGVRPPVGGAPEVGTASIGGGAVLFFVQKHGIRSRCG